MRSRVRSIVSLLTVAVCIAWPAATAAAQSRLLTPELVARIQSVGEIALSPDGELVAFTRSVPRIPGEDKDGPAWSELYLLEVKTGEERPFVTGEVNVGSIAWTPDGRSVSFLAKREGDEETALYLIPRDGGEARKAVAFETSIAAYSWAPDSSRVAFIAPEPEEEETAELEEKGFNQEVYEENLDRRLVYKAAPFSNSPADRIDLDGAAFSLAWSSRQDRLAVSLAPTPLVDDRYMMQRVHVVDPANGEVVVSFDNPGKLGKIAWSKDGSQLALVSGADLYDPSAGRIMIGRMDGSLSPPINKPEGDAVDLAWLEDGSLLYIHAEGVWTSLEKLDPDGRETSEILEPGGPIYSSLEPSPTGGVILTASAPQHPTEVYLLNPAAKRAERLTDSNPWLSEIRLATQEAVSYKARDGLELEGLLIRPLDEEKGRTYPLILTVHGGPESHYGNGWLTSYSSPGQVAAARGMAVFYPNYRGSTGRGVEFSKLSQADPAGQEFDDLIDGVDHLISIGLVDRDRVGVTGGSYGGYATGWCATYYTERFAAGVMFVGISNKVSKVGTTDIPNEEFYVHARKRVWDDWDFFLERSPVYYADQSRTPLLILHGKEDPRVNVGQSRELYRHLKLHGNAPVRLVLYPGEGHGNRRAASRYDYSVRSLRWFEHYLKGPGGDPPPADIGYEILKEKEGE